MWLKIRVVDKKQIIGNVCGSSGPNSSILTYFKYMSAQIELLLLKYFHFMQVYTCTLLHLRHILYFSTPLHFFDSFSYYVFILFPPIEDHVAQDVSFS